MDLLLILSIFVGMTGLYPYLRDTVRKDTRPRLVTWAVWEVLALITMTSALIDGHLASAALSVQGVIGCVWLLY